MAPSGTYSRIATGAGGVDVHAAAAHVLYLAKVEAVQAEVRVAARVARLVLERRFRVAEVAEGEVIGVIRFVCDFKVPVPVVRDEQTAVPAAVRGQPGPARRRVQGGRVAHQAVVAVAVQAANRGCGCELP